MSDINILGISAFYHDSAAVLLRNGEIVAAAQEERFTRKKFDCSFPANAVKYCLAEGGVSIDRLDAVVFYEKPFIKFERLLETYYIFSPKGLGSFLSAIPIWIKEKLFLKKLILDELLGIEFFDKKKLNLLFSNHHLSHAASAFYPSPFEKAAILTIDAVGEWATAAISKGEGNRISTLYEMKFPHSVGMLYSSFTYFLGFKVNSGEYKLMGLAPYGNSNSDRVKRYTELIKKEIVDIKDDGSIWLNQMYFDYSTGLKMIKDKKWEKIFGFSTRNPESDLEQHHCDLAYAIQNVTEEIVLKMAVTAKKVTKERYLCLAGGVALNCVANGRLLQEKIFEDIWIQPAAGDAGGALGAAFSANYLYFDKKRKVGKGRDSMKGSYLGPEYCDEEIKKVVRKYGAKCGYYDFDRLCSLTADLISKGKIVGWFQGRMEWGPRALGNRSILGDVRNEKMQKKLNLKIKYRESFRPFAPSVLMEDVKDFFKSGHSSPYMLLITDVVENRLSKLPANFEKLPLKKKLYCKRSDIQAITHLDFSARLQTVHRETNYRYWMLINEFKKKTKYGIVVNTSFNVRGEPIVCSPDDAYRCFMRTEMDYLVMGNYLFDKKKQEVYHDFSEEFELD